MAQPSSLMRQHNCKLCCCADLIIFHWQLSRPFHGGKSTSVTPWLSSVVRQLKNTTGVGKAAGLQLSCGL
jgi:hypothetical protein